jgi:hypothetical protein
MRPTKEIIRDGIGSHKQTSGHPGIRRRQCERTCGTKGYQSYKKARFMEQHDQGKQFMCSATENKVPS